jgi:hypothetical protein
MCYKWGRKAGESMTISDQFTIAMQAFQELEPEISQRRRDLLPPVAPEYPRVLQNTSPLTVDSLLLGFAADGTPLLLNLSDPTPGSVLVVGDRGSGKTAFLQALARSSDRLSDPGDVVFGVLTQTPREWMQIETLPGNMGVYPPAHASAGEILERMTAWGQQSRSTGKMTVLLLVDGLDSLLQSGSISIEDLHWLLAHGPEHRIWPVVTLNAGRMPRFTSWLEPFGSFIFGHIRQSNLAQVVAGDAGVDLPGLIPGLQFNLHKDDSWINFRIPTHDGERGQQ